jgi:hypothetical protein
MTGIFNKPSVLKVTLPRVFVMLIAFLCRERRQRGDVMSVADRNVGKTFVRNSSLSGRVRYGKPAAQNIGLYAQALSRRGEYNAKSAEAKTLRDALFDAAGETRMIVAAAAFRALADMVAFNPQIDIRRLDSMLAGCADDHSAAPAARAMAVQLCGERRVKSARPASSESSPLPIRRRYFVALRHARWRVSGEFDTISRSETATS